MILENPCHWKSNSGLTVKQRLPLYDFSVSPKLDVRRSITMQHLLLFLFLIIFETFECLEVGTKIVNRRPKLCTTKQGDACVFPFTYRGVRYREPCVDDDIMKILTLFPGMRSAPTPGHPLHGAPPSPTPRAR